VGFALAGDHDDAWDIETEKIIAVAGLAYWCPLPEPPAR
jgi:hypothetical protein